MDILIQSKITKENEQVNSNENSNNKTNDNSQNKL